MKNNLRILSSFSKKKNTGCIAPKPVFHRCNRFHNHSKPMQTILSHPKDVPRHLNKKTHLRTIYIEGDPEPTQPMPPKETHTAIPIHYRFSDLPLSRPLFCKTPPLPKDQANISQHELISALSQDGVNLGAISSIRYYDQKEAGFVKTTQWIPIQNDQNGNPHLELAIFKNNITSKVFSKSKLSFFTLGFLKQTLHFNIDFKFKFNSQLYERKYRARLSCFGPKLDFGYRLGSTMFFNPVLSKLIFHEKIHVKSGFDFSLFPISFTRARFDDGSSLINFGTSGISFGLGFILGGELEPIQEEKSTAKQILSSIQSGSFQDALPKTQQTEDEEQQLLLSPDSLLKEELSVKDLKGSLDK